MKTQYKHTASGEIRFNCPMCLDTKFHLYYNPSKSVYYCHRCQFKGHGFPKLVKTSFTLIPKVGQETKAKGLKWYPLKWPPSGIMESAVWDYLLNTREVPEKTIRHFSLGWTVDIPLSVVVPVIYKGDVKFLQVRFLCDLIKPKYLNYAVGDKVVKASLVFNYDSVCTGVETLYIMEGVFDVIKSAPSTGICIFGKFISLQQLQIIRSISCKKVVLSFDADVKIKELMSSIKSLGSFRTVGIKQLPQGKDPGDLNVQEFSRLPELDAGAFILEALGRHAKPTENCA